MVIRDSGHRCGIPAQKGRFFKMACLSAMWCYGLFPISSNMSSVGPSPPGSGVCTFSLGSSGKNSGATPMSGCCITSNH